jgi:sugar-specific transcriptional regulator TrmB
MATKFLKNCLLQISISPAGADLYIQLMEDRGLGISNLAKINKLSRMTIYKLLEELVKFGLVVDTADFRSGIRIQEPDHILGELYNKEKQIINDINGLSTMLPQIKKHYFEKQDDYITIYQGKTQLQSLYRKILDNTKGSFKVVGNVEEIVNLLGVDFEYAWFRERIKRGIWMNLLAFEDPMVKKHFHLGKEELRTIKLLPEKFKFDGIIIMNETMITQWNPVIPKAISIQDPTFYTMFSSLFDIMWDKG